MVDSGRYSSPEVLPGDTVSNHRLAQHVVTAVVCRQPLQTPEDVRQTVMAVEDILNRYSVGPGAVVVAGLFLAVLSLIAGFWVAAAL